MSSDKGFHNTNDVVKALNEHTNYKWSLERVADFDKYVFRASVATKSRLSGNYVLYYSETEISGVDLHVLSQAIGAPLPAFLLQKAQGLAEDLFVQSGVPAIQNDYELPNLPELLK